DKQGTGFGDVLRQDPDVIFVGEIRDEQTARTAMQAAMTGHLVFSTVHAKDTMAAVFRLLDLGVEPYLVANSLDLVLAQRLRRAAAAAYPASAMFLRTLAFCSSANSRSAAPNSQSLSVAASKMASRSSP